MAKGIFTYRGSVSANGAIVSVAADERIYLRWVNASVGTAGTGSRFWLAEGASGPVIARLATTVADAMINLLYYTGSRQYDGNPLAPGTALWATVTGTG